jgi:hypothetical protein
MLNIAIVGPFGYSNPHGLKSRDRKRLFIKATIRIIYIMEPNVARLSAPYVRIYNYFFISVSYITKLQNEIKTDRVISDANSHAIESRLDIRWKFAFEPREIEIAMKVGEDRALGPQLGDPVDGFRQGKMTGVRRVAQSVDNPQVEPLQKTEALDGNGVEIGRIGHLAKAKTERVNLAMFKLERNGIQSAARTIYSYRLACYEAMFI